MRTLPETLRHPVRLLEEFERLQKASPCKCSAEAYSELMQSLKGKVKRALLAEHFRSATLKNLLDFKILGVLVNERNLEIDIKVTMDECELCGQMRSPVYKIVNFRPNEITLCRACSEGIPERGLYYLKVAIPETFIEEALKEVSTILAPVSSPQNIRKSMCILGEAELFRRAIDPILGVWAENRVFLVKSYKPTRLERALLSLAR